MKKHFHFFLLIIGCCLIHCILLAQDSTEIVYSVRFPEFKTRLTKLTKATLNKVAKTMKDHPDWNFVVTGYCGGSENQKLSAANWDRVNNIVSYLTIKQGINAERLIFKYGSEGGDCNMVDLAFTEDTVTKVPPPHPNLRKKN
ncbi:MAG TPA: OmpA family protein [Chitinophagaceae bacterium]|nr:OmpA family protein [Chitinophagaceae bacterium]